MDTDNKGTIPVTSTQKTSASWPTLHHPIAEMERALDRFFGRSWPDFTKFDSLISAEDLRSPSLDVVDRENEVLVRAEIPGIDKKDIEISLNNNVLSIKGQSKKEEKEEKGDYYRREISSASFARSVTVPANIDISKAAANLKDGLLEIKLPKTEASKRRNIEIQ
jgi:HSP20 family protein